MSLFHTALFAHLNDNAALTAVVANRIYPTKAPLKAELPCIIYQRFGDFAERYQGGACGLASAMYEISIIADSPKGADVVAEVIRNIMDGLQGTVAGGLNIRSARLTNESDGSILFQGSETERYLIEQDWDFWYFRSTPTL